MGFKLNLVKNRHGNYYWRKIVPKRFREEGQGREIRLSLRTKNLDTARSAAMVLALSEQGLLPAMDLNEVLKRLNSGTIRPLEFTTQVGGVPLVMKDILTPADRQFAREMIHDLRANAPAPVPIPPRITTPPDESGADTDSVVLYADVMREYLLDLSTKSMAAKGRRDKELALQWISDCLPDLEMRQFRPSNMQGFKNIFMFGSKTGPRRLKTLFGHLSLFLEWARAREYYRGENPTTHITKELNKDISNAPDVSYDPFTLNELRQIFDATTYKAFLNKPDYYWLPFIALFTGGRTSEMAALTLSTVDIQTENGITYLRPTKVKNKQSRRKIPIHRTLIELGFLQFIEDMKSEGYDHLFPYLGDGKNGKGKNMGARFHKYLLLIGIKTPLKVFYSFRHTAISHLVAGNNNSSLIQMVTGHLEQAGGRFQSSQSHERYAHAENAELAVLQEIVEKLKFDIDFSAFKYDGDWMKRRTRHLVTLKNADVDRKAGRRKDEA